MPGKDPASTASGQHNVYLQRAYALDSVSSAEKLYNEWAKEYDSDLEKHDYASPQAAVDTLIKHWPKTNNNAVQILDAGCGTGLVGVCLNSSRSSGWIMDGVDLTQGMLDVAASKNIYRTLFPADLNKKLIFLDGRYDAVTCVGTLTKGHVGPGCLGEFVRVVGKGGVVIATIHDEIWESLGYKKEVEKLEEEGKVEVLGTEEFGIIKGETSGGRMVVLRKN